MLALQVFLHLMKRKWAHIDTRGNSGMQATLVLYQIIHHPGSGGTAGNEHDVASASSPTIPEIFQSRNKIRLLRIYPRHLIDKHHFLPVCIKQLQIFLKSIKGIKPIGKLIWLTARKFLQCLAETRQLSLARKIMSSHKCKVIGTLIVLVNKEGLAYSSSSIHYHKLRAVGFHHPIQFQALSLPTYQLIACSHFLRFLFVSILTANLSQFSRKTKKMGDFLPKSHSKT